MEHYGPLLPRFLALLVLLLCKVFGQNEEYCTLASLQLRSGDRPVDLVPSFSPDEFSYAATLDFSMDTFSIDAQPSPGCELGGEPNRPITAPAAAAPGETTSINENIFAKDPTTGKEQAYRIQVSKLGGSETEALQLRVIGGKLLPSFQPSIREYSVDLDIKQELAEVAYVLQDSGQKIACEALPETSQAPAQAPAQAASRRLQEEGESQYHERRQAFPIDVGRFRQLKLTIESADPMQAAMGTYVLNVKRANCTNAKPLFDPVSGACAVNCPESTYANLDAGRCSFCNRNCRICRSLSTCELCLEDTIHRSYRLQPDGSCIEAQGRFVEKYYWWCVSVAIFAVLVLLVCAGLLCQCLADCSSPRRKGYDSDSDD